MEVIKTNQYKNLQHRCGETGNQTDARVRSVLICAVVYLGSRHHQPPGQHLPGGAKGQVARNTSGLRARRRSGLLLHHQAAGQRQQPVRGPLGLTTGVKGDQACCRKQGVLSKTQRCMLISPFIPSSLRFALILGPLPLAAAAMTGASCHVQHVSLVFLPSFPLGMISGFDCLAGGEINLIAAFLSFSHTLNLNWALRL